MQDIVAIFSSLLPTHSERILMSMGAAIGGILSVLLGGISDSFLWLVGFMVADYVTGVSAAIYRHRLSGLVAVRGLTKKFIIVGVVVLAHGLDKMAGFDFIQSAAVFAYGVAEFWSILANLGRLGFTNILPDQLSDQIHNTRSSKSSALVQASCSGFGPKSSNNKRGVSNENVQ